MFNICKALSLKFESSLKIWAESLLEILFDTARAWEPDALRVKDWMHTCLYEICKETFYRTIVLKYYSVLISDQSEIAWVDNKLGCGMWGCFKVCFYCFFADSIKIFYFLIFTGSDLVIVWLIWINERLIEISFLKDFSNTQFVSYRSLDSAGQVLFLGSLQIQGCSIDTFYEITWQTYYFT